MVNEVMRLTAAMNDCITYLGVHRLRRRARVLRDASAPPRPAPLPRTDPLTPLERELAHDRSAYGARPARHQPEHAWLAAGGRLPDAAEQPRPRGGRAPGGVGRLRGHRKGGT